MASDSVYQVCGGFDKLVPFIEGVCARMLKDGTLGPYFRGHNNKSKERLQQQFISFLIKASGGPAGYSGNDLRIAHEGLSLGPAEWKRFIEVVNEALDKYKFTPLQRKAFLSILEPTERDVVEARS